MDWWMTGKLWKLMVVIFGEGRAEQSDHRTVAPIHRQAGRSVSILSIDVIVLNGSATQRTYDVVHYWMHRNTILRVINRCWGRWWWWRRRRRRWNPPWSSHYQVITRKIIAVKWLESQVSSEAFPENSSARILEFGRHFQKIRINKSNFSTGQLNLCPMDCGQSIRFWDSASWPIWLFALVFKITNHGFGHIWRFLLLVLMTIKQVKIMKKVEDNVQFPCLAQQKQNSSSTGNDKADQKSGEKCFD